MLLKKYIISYITIALFCIYSPETMATVLEKKCGEGLFIIEIYNGFDFYEIKYKIYYKVKNRPKKMIFKTGKGVILSAACIKNKNKKELMLFNEISGGNGAPEDRFGLYDPSSGKMLIKPISWDKGNSKEVEKIIGYSPFEIDEDEDYFCCFNRE